MLDILTSLRVQGKNPPNTQTLVGTLDKWYKALLWLFKSDVDYFLRTFTGLKTRKNVLFLSD